MLQSCFQGLEQCKLQLDDSIQLNLQRSQKEWGVIWTTNCSETLDFLNFQMKAYAQSEVLSLICSRNLFGCYN